MPLKLNKNWKFKEHFPTISAYTTTYNCVAGGYPFVKAIKSFAWADQVVVVDGGSTDGTLEALEELQKEMDNLEVHDIPLDEEDPGKDGQLKTMSRAMTDSALSLQFDADELCMGSPEKWKKEAKKLQSLDFDILSMLVVEPFGSMTNLRMNKEHNPWKWRLSKNKPEIVHGIPAHDRLEKDDKVYSKGNSDGTFPVHVVTNQMISNYIPVYLQELVSLKASGDKKAYASAVSDFLKKDEPWILHLGHVDLHKKLSYYLKSWHDWWCCLYDKDPANPQNNLYFKGHLPSEVTEEMINEKVQELIKQTPSVKLKGLENVSMEKVGG